MGRRNIYVQGGQEGLYDQAALLAGSLSAAVEQGLHLFVAQRRGGLRGQLGLGQRFVKQISRYGPAFQRMAKLRELTVSAAERLLSRSG